MNLITYLKINKLNNIKLFYVNIYKIFNNKIKKV